MNVRKKRVAFYGWLLVAICLLVQSVGVGASIYLYSVVASALEEEFPRGRFISMMGATGLLLVMALMSPKVGVLLDRHPIKWVLIAGSIIMGLGFLLISVSTQVWHVIVCYALFIAAGLATLGPLASSALLSRWFVRNRGLALGIAALGAQFGGLIYPPVIAYMIELYNWRIALGGLGVFVICVIPLMVYFTVVDQPQYRGLLPDGDAVQPVVATTTEITMEPAPKVSLANLFTQRNFLLLVLFIGIASAVNTIFVSNLALFATDLGETRERGAYVVSLLALLGMASSPLVGRLCDLLNIKLVAVSLLLCSMLAVVTFVGATNYSLLLLGAVLQGFTGGGIVPLWASLVGRLYDIHIYGQVMGASTLVVIAMAAPAPLFAGWLYDLTSSYWLLLLIMLGTTIVATLLALLLRVPEVGAEKGERAAALH